MSTIKDLNLAPSGERKIRWVEAHMPVLRDIGSDFAREKPFTGLKIALSVHLEAKTAYLCRVLEMGGAEMHVTGSNPLSTQDDVAAALAAKGMDVHAVYGCTDEEYHAHLRISFRRSSAAAKRRRRASTACASWTVPGRCASR